jgi:hypothetical protein
VGCKGLPSRLKKAEVTPAYANLAAMKSPIGALIVGSLA